VLLSINVISSLHFIFMCFWWINSFCFLPYFSPPG
jgi:hypothetical protein